MKNILIFKKKLIVLYLFLIITGCFADNKNNQMSNNNINVKLTSSFWSTFAIMQDGSLWGWGNNGRGRLGIGTEEDNITTPVQIGNENNWASVSASIGHTVAIKKDGSLWAWGSNGSGQIGNGQFDFNHTLAIKKDGSLWAWGANYNGQLGINSKMENNYYPFFSSPIRVGNDTNWLYVSTYNTYNVAIKNDGTLWEWGIYSGDVYRTSLGIITPVQVGFNNDWLLVSAGINYAVAIKKNGTLWYWSNIHIYNEVPIYDEIFPGSYTFTINRNNPTQIGNNKKWIFASKDFSIDENGSLYSFNIINIKNQNWKIFDACQIELNIFETNFNKKLLAVTQYRTTNYFENNIESVNKLVCITDDGTIWERRNPMVDEFILILPK